MRISEKKYNLAAAKYYRALLYQPMKAQTHIEETLTEITLLEANECLHLEDRHKQSFDYPLHKHQEFELNFVENGRGLRRTIGDSMEDVDDYDLVLIGGGLEHQWSNPDDFEPRPMHEVTIQFSADIFGSDLLSRQPFSSIQQMLHNAKRGICFSQEVIRQVHDSLKFLITEKPGFYRFNKFMEVLYILSQDTHGHLLASEEFSKAGTSSDSRRIQMATDFIKKHFKEDIHLADLSDLVCMTPTAFSKFFSLRTHKSVSDYIIDQRLGYASRQLIDSAQTVIEICYDSGFNNVSNFNRLFKKRKGLTPTEFRDNYQKHKMLPKTAEMNTNTSHPAPKLQK